MVKLVVVYKYVHCLPLLYCITHMSCGYGCEHFDNITLFLFQEQMKKKKSFSVFHILRYK